MMNCQQAKPLIPLFVEADLDAGDMQQVNEHLATCNSCREIVAEFQASQSLLRATALPAFDEAIFAEMRTAVQREIARPTSTDWLTPRWNWKLAGAVSAICLLLGGFVLYRQLPPKHERQQVAAREDRPATLATSSSTSWTGVRAKRSSAIGTVPPAVASLSQGTVPRAVASHRPSRKPSLHSRALATAGGTVPPPAPPTAELVTASPAPALALTAIPETATSAAEPEMLRMEIQTADPNIKIIWLTPQEPARTNTAPIIEATK